ncbi:MAG: LPS-assembly protein LptD [Sideroxydans sp.]|nr:LPS-assembly protein LptD [Sideroxydans sp.]
MLRLPRFALLLIALVAPNWAYGEDAPIPLKVDRTFNRLPASEEQTSAFFIADQIDSKHGEKLIARGNAELRQDGQVVTSDILTYDEVSKDLIAEGGVRIEQGDTTVVGPKLQMNMDSNIGDMQEPRFTFAETGGRGSADVAHIASRKEYELEGATYTTCPIDNDDWLLKMSRLDIDRTSQIGTAYNARVLFMGLPILYTPWMNFPLSDKRRSGLLGPTFGSTTTGGREVTIPLYLNVADNFDATLSPRYMNKRGTQLNNEFRYLQPNAVGEVHADVLQSDKISQADRTRFSLKHAQQLGGGFSGYLNLNRVSDNNYYRDLADNLNATSQTNLLQEGVLNYSGGWWSAVARVQHYQTLQDPLAPVAQPYWRQPQIGVNANRTAFGSNVSVTGEYVDFRHPDLNGQRMMIYPSISYPLLNAPGYFLTPKIGVHSTRYILEDSSFGYARNNSRTLPIMSIDGGLVFERSDSFFGNGYMQTLEPRAYYVHIPYKDQSNLPNFDTAQAPFSFGQMFTENRFLGNDRVGDADMLTLALTSRAIDDDDGTERIRVAVAERFSFTAPQVNLSTPSDSNSRSDILTTVGGKLTRSWRLDSLFQYNPNLGHVESYNAAARYNPEPGKLLNLGYRYTRDVLRQMDVSTQWPISGRWHAVGRLNYSLQDDRIVEALGGLEYNQDCWALRLIAQSFATATKESTTGIFVQLELNDFVRIGSDPLAALRTSVMGYTKLNDLPTATPIKGLQ